MTREQIYEDYNVDGNGVVRSPGKFEGEPAWAVYFWHVYLDDGCADAEDKDGRLYFDLRDEDKTVWPELRGYSTVTLEESEQGFVYADVHGED